MKPIRNTAVVWMSLLTVAGVLIAALAVTLAHQQKRPLTPPTEYRSMEQTDHRSTPSSSVSSDAPALEEPTSSQSTVSQEPQPPASIATGRYTKGEAYCTIHSCQDGFLEATLGDGGITMEIAGQLVGRELTATETDSEGNTVEVHLLAEDAGLRLDTVALLQNEEGAPYLKLSGLFRLE